MDLMTPRWRVKSLWPACETMGFTKVGDIITDDSKTVCLNQNGVPVVPIQWDIFPALFEKVEWWEDRTKEELTGYIKLYRAGRWTVYEINILDKDLMKWKFGGIRRSEFLPATKSEYIAYQEQQKGGKNE